EWTRLHPDRFPGFIASLPMNHPDAAVAEAERAVCDLGAAGLQLYTNVNGHPLDEPPTLAVIEQLARLGRPLWLHPIRPLSFAVYASARVRRYALGWAFGGPYEPSGGMARLALPGLFDRWPDLVIIPHHAGGILPMMDGRIAAGLDLVGQRNPPEL